MTSFVVAALYKFVDLPNFKALQAPLRECCKKNGIMGTILLAHEGINGTVAGTRTGINALRQFFEDNPDFHNLEYKESAASEMPFYRLKIRLKKEIVTLGRPEANPNKVVGTYVAPEDWNALIQDPEVLVLDTRNEYEMDIGTFKGAKNPHTVNFREFPDYVEKNLDPKKHKRVATFCTGGIRCEKATSYMLQQGFEEVYHLKGGILKYIEDIPEEESLWEGDCFVFDGRVSVTHKLKEGDYAQCFGCRHPVSEEEMKSPDYKPGVSCPHCIHERSAAQRARAQERQNQILLAKRRKVPHLGAAVSEAL